MTSVSPTLPYFFTRSSLPGSPHTQLQPTCASHLPKLAFWQFIFHFPTAVFVVFSHAHHAANTYGPCKSERTHPGHTDDGLLHRLKDLPKTSAAGATTHHVWEVQALPRGVMTDEVSDLLHAQYRLSLLQWNAGTARRQPTQLVTAMCGAFNVVLLQEAADHVTHVSDQFNTYTDGDNLAILLNKDTFLPDADKYAIVEESTSKKTWGLTALVVRGHLRRPEIGAPKTVTVC